MKPLVLFLCTHNSARSQMAEGLLRRMGGDRFEVASAGTEPSKVNPLAIAAMSEIGIDISAHSSKGAKEFFRQKISYVVTVCDDAKEKCPIYPFALKKMHWSLPDPSRAEGSEEERLMAFRKVRDDLTRRIQILLEED